MKRVVIAAALASTACAFAPAHAQQKVRINLANAFPNSLTLIGEALPLLDLQLHDGGRAGLSVAQLMYTPGEISSARPNPNDRPYAGLLYGGLIHELWGERDLIVLELDAGLVGPYSFADFAQTEWHRVLGIGLPQGWAHQIPTALVLQLGVEWKHLLVQGAIGDSGFDYFDLSLENRRKTDNDVVSAAARASISSPFSAVRSRCRSTTPDTLVVRCMMVA